MLVFRCTNIPFIFEITPSNYLKSSVRPKRNSFVLILIQSNADLYRSRLQHRQNRFYSLFLFCRLSFFKLTNFNRHIQHLMQQNSKNSVRKGSSSLLRCSIWTLTFSISLKRRSGGKRTVESCFWMQQWLRRTSSIPRTSTC